MRSFVNTFLVALLVSAMSNPSVVAAAKPLGTVVAAENAHLGDAVLTLGTNVFPGDFLQTDSSGTLRLRIGLTQMYLAAGSAALLESAPDQATGRSGAQLVRGTVGFSSALPDSFQLDTPVATVRPYRGSVFGEVTLVGPNTIVVAAYRGSLLVTGNGAERVISEGDSVNVSFLPDPDPAQGPQGAGTGNTKSQRSGSYGVANHGQLVFTAIIIGLAAGGAYAAWHLAAESDPQPH